jgi:hypothetical protein
VRRASNALDAIPEAALRHIERWWRTRNVVAASVAAGGVAAVIADSAGAATVLLVLAVGAAAATMVAMAWWRHVGCATDPIAAAARAAKAVLLADVALALAAVRVGTPAVSGFAAPLLLLALALDVRALWQVCEVRRDVERRRLAAVLSAVREPIGIVRARAEALRLALREEPAAAEVGHELSVLEANADLALQRLKEPPPSSRLDSPAAPTGPQESAPGRQAWPNESRPMPS